MLKNLKVYVLESNGAKYFLDVFSISYYIFNDGKRGYKVELDIKNLKTLKFLLEDWEYSKNTFSYCVLMENNKELYKLLNYYDHEGKYYMTFKNEVK